VGSVPLDIDCKSALRLTHNPEFHSKSKHIDVEHHFIREKAEEGESNTMRVNTKDNLADILTKPLRREAHESLIMRVGLSRRQPRGASVGGSVDWGHPHLSAYTSASAY
jgi:hypothetical protein